MLSGTYYAHNYASMHNRQAGLYILQGVASAHAKTQHGVLHREQPAPTQKPNTVYESPNI